MNDNNQTYIYEPLLAYKNILKDKHHENVVNYFNKLKEKSEVDVDLNKETVKKINKKKKELNVLNNTISRQKNIKTFYIITSIISLIVALYSIFTIGEQEEKLLYILLFIFGVLIFGFLIFYVAKKLTPRIKKLMDEASELEKKINNLINDAWSQMSSLNRLFKKEMSLELFTKTLPIINMDPVFDSKRFDYLVNKFGLQEVQDINRSTLYVQSGDIEGNPFYIGNDLIHHLGTKVYSNSITIHWTTTSTINGKTVTNHHSQVLTASVEKPHPYYNEQSYLVYGNEAAPDLIFNRKETDAENLNQQQIDRKVKKEIKKLKKKSSKEIGKGGTYTVLGDDEFEVLFGATDRNNEVQFRLLFTPLARKQLLQLMKEKEIGYGDEFDFYKHKMINVVVPKHLNMFKLNINDSYYNHYDYEVIKNTFITYNDEYFKQIFFSFAPVLSIPLYQHHKPREYIYKDLYDSYVSFYEHEKMCNMMNENEFKHPLSNTRNILKTSVVKSGDNCDTIKVEAHGYETIDRVDYITKRGGDGKNHVIAVHWVEFIPVMQESVIDIEMFEDDKEKTWGEKLDDYLSNYQGEHDNYYYTGRLLARIIKKL